MSRYRYNKVIRNNLTSYPAFTAWLKVCPESEEPKWLEVLKEQKDDSHKSAIYRLGGVLEGSSSVIAKRCRINTYKIERLIYENILPALSIPHLKYYGQMEEPGGIFGWVFIENAGEQHYSPELADHRILGARWFGHLHLSTEGIDTIENLPLRDLSYFFNQLLFARERIHSSLDDKEVNKQDIKVLKSILSQLNIIEAHWHALHENLSHVPRTLIHNDIKPKNMRVRAIKNKLEFMIFDWECAGYGIIAADLRQIDLLAYYSTVKSKWPHLIFKDIENLSNIGELFRYILCIKWESHRLQYKWIERAIRRYRDYEDWFTNIMDCFGWKYYG